MFLTDPCESRESRAARRCALVGVAAAALIATAGLIDAALAQGSPFGVGTPKGGAAPPAASSGLVGWIMVKQAEFYKGLSGAIRAARTDGSALWVLFGLSFAYGVFHAAGPGHGKAVISSYVVANRETWWRGVVLSFASAMVQAAVAVAIVGVAAVLLNATAATMRTTVYWIEVVSYSLIIAIGLRLVWVKGRAALATLRDLRKPKTVGAAATPAHLRDHHEAPRRAVAAPAHHDHAHHAHHDHARHDHAHHDHAHHDHAHHDHAPASHSHQAHGHDHSHHDHAHHDHADCGHDHASAWGHAHAPEPKDLAGPGGWKRGLTAILAVGLRPCSGAILVLVFTLAQGLFWAGVVATFVMGLGTAIMVAAIAVVAVFATSWADRLASSRGGYGMLFMRGIEICAALLITAFGTLLLMGYMAQERLGGF